MNVKKLIGAGLIAATAALASGGPAHAETKEVRISKGYGISYLPLIVMADQKLLEKQAAEMGMPDVKATWVMLDGGNVINDAMISGSLDIAGTGTPGFILLWSKTHGNDRIAVTGVSALGSIPLWLNSNRPEVKSLSDFSSKDKIALPGVKTSLSAIVLQMVVAQQFGIEAYDKLDSLTINLPHPEGLSALTSGQTEVTAHFTSPPFSFMELKNPKVHRVLDASDVLGEISTGVVYAPKRFADANPKIIEAFIKAQDEANALIAKDVAMAADIFLRSTDIKVSKEEVMEMITSKGTSYSTTPNGVMQFADFMHRAGTIKNEPAAWSDLFVPQLSNRSGS